MTIESGVYGNLPDGTAVTRHVLSNQQGTRAQVIAYGAALAGLDVADRRGLRRNVILGCADLAGYLADPGHLGAIAGRYANRIAWGRFVLDGVVHRLDRNAPPHTLHGGARGFGRVAWQAEVAGSVGREALLLRHRSPDGDQGFPGTLDVEVRYALGEDDALTIDHVAATDRPTVVNLASHAYFNLAGEGAGDVYGHELTIAADAFTPVDAGMIPTGEIRPVAGTPFDFRAPATIGARIREADEQLLLARGFDHNFVLRPPESPGAPRFAARLREPRSGRVLEVSTTEPGLQLYTGNVLDGTRRGTSGRPYRQSDGLCLEAQHFPDSPNQPAFPSTVLRPGELFRSTTVYRFTVED